MQLLLIGSNSQVGQALKLLAKAEGIPVWLLETDDTGYVAAKKVSDILQQNSVDYVINTALYPNYLKAESDPSAVEKVNLQQLCDLAKVCVAADVPLIQLSDVYVFDGKKEGLYHEADEPLPLGIYGKALLRGELSIQEQCTKYVILRTGVVFSQWGNNYLTQILNNAHSSEALIVPEGLKGCPTPATDVARVIIAILKQLNCASNTWGLFHYCSADTTSAYDFTDTVLSVMSQHVGSVEKEILSTPQEDDAEMMLHPKNTVMSCRKLLNTFGIKRRPWRSGLTNIIREIYPDNTHISEKN